MTTFGGEDGSLSLRMAEDELWQNGSPLDHAALDEQVSICRTIQNNFHLKKNKQCIYVVREEISTLPERKFSDSLKKFEMFQFFMWTISSVCSFDANKELYKADCSYVVVLCDFVVVVVVLFQTFELFKFFVSTH